MDRQDQTSRHQGMATSRDGTPPSRRTPPLHGTPPQHRTQPPFTQPPPRVLQPDLTQPPPPVLQPVLTQPPPPVFQPVLTQPPPPVMPQQSMLPQFYVMLGWPRQHDVTLRTSTRTEGHLKEEWQNNDIQEIEERFRRQRFLDRDFQGKLWNSVTDTHMTNVMRKKPVSESSTYLLGTTEYEVKSQVPFPIPALNDNTQLRGDQWQTICNALLNLARCIRIAVPKRYITRDFLSLWTKLNDWHSEHGDNIIFELLLNIMFLPSRFYAPDTEPATHEDLDHALHMVWQAMDILITYPYHHYVMLFVPGTSNRPLKELAASFEWRDQPSHQDVYRTAMLDVEAEAEDLDITEDVDRYRLAMLDAEAEAEDLDITEDVDRYRPAMLDAEAEDLDIAAEIDRYRIVMLDAEAEGQPSKKNR